jgi:type I restriction enzyme M protein
VLTNPPFGSRIKVSDPEILRQFALGHRWSSTPCGWAQDSALRDAQDPQILFLELCIKLLKPGGRLAIVLPEGVFGNTGLGYVWDFVRREGEITHLIDCPRTTFQPSTDTKTNVLFFRRHDRKASDAPKESAVWTAVALHAGHDRRGRTVNSEGRPVADDYQLIGAAAAEPKPSVPWQNVVVADPYYLVPRYYDRSASRALEEGAKRLNASLVTLGDLERDGQLRIRKGHEIGAEMYGSGEIPFIRTSDLANYEVFADPTRGVSEEVYARYSEEQRLRPGDVLLVTDGRYRIGRTAILHTHNSRCLVQSHIRILQMAPGASIDSVELLYLLNLPAVVRQVRNLVFIQSTLGALGRRLYEIQIPIPAREPEWKARIDEFRELLENRAAMLARLQQFEATSFDSEL